jgi:hypothetical protein
MQNKMNGVLFETTHRRKRVRFSEFSTLVLLEPKTREDFAATWYSRQELAEFKKDVRVSLHIAREIAKLRPRRRRRSIDQDSDNVESIDIAKRRRRLIDQDSADISDQVIDK